MAKEGINVGIRSFQHTVHLSTIGQLLERHHHRRHQFQIPQSVFQNRNRFPKRNPCFSKNAVEMTSFIEMTKNLKIYGKL